MNGGILPLLLLSLALGLALSFVSRAAAWRALAAFAVAAGVAMFVPIPSHFADAFFFGFWPSVIALCGLVYVPLARTPGRAAAAGLFAGLWWGLGASLTGLHPLQALALLPLFAFVPGNWLTQRGYRIVIQVVASWTIAIAALSLFVSLMPTPGYKPDHME